MTKWAKSLIRLSTYEVETLQKRLAEVVTRRTHIEMKIATLDAQYELECVNAASDPAMGHNLTAYKAGHRLRREGHQSELDLIVQEEEGVRDQLSYAFEDLKKFDIPTLLLHGEDDQIVPVKDSAKKAARLIRDVEAIYYPNAPHGITATHIDQVNADLLAFLKKGQEGVKAA